MITDEPTFNDIMPGDLLLDDDRSPLSPTARPPCFLVLSVIHGTDSVRVLYDTWLDDYVGYRRHVPLRWYGFRLIRV